MNRPEKLNALNSDLVARLEQALQQLEADEAIGAIVITGAGDRAFSAGSHVGEFEAQRGSDGRARHELEERVSRRLADLPMPTIAAIEGNALGGGLELALCCDLRVASVRARLGLPEVRLAVTPGSGGTQRLPMVVGPARAKELILTGRVIGAEEAGRIGLVNQVVPAGEARAASDELADEIAARGPLAVREAKRLIGRFSNLDIDAGLAAELDASERVFASDDMIEGASAFFAKRDPVYRGR